MLGILTYLDQTTHEPQPMSNLSGQVILALSDNTKAGRIVVNRAVRLAEILRLPVDIHYLLQIPNGQKPLTTELIDQSLDELIAAEKELSTILDEQKQLATAFASVDPLLQWDTPPEGEPYLTFLTGDLHARMKVDGMHYLTFPDSLRKVDISKIALLCERTSDREHLVKIAGLMTSTEATVQIIVEEGIPQLAKLNEIFGAGRNNKPIESFQTEKQLQRILKKLKPELICIPGPQNDGSKINWLRSIHAMDVLVY